MPIPRRLLILRNMTIKEDVCKDTFACADYEWAFDAVLIAFTTWTDDDSGLMGLPAWEEWAGNRCNIAPLSAVENADELWDNVTEMAVTRLTETAGCMIWRELSFSRE